MRCIFDHNFELIHRQQNIISIMNLFALFVMAVLIIGSSASDYTLVLHSQERGAACLDGTPTGLYYHMGSGANRNKFMIYFNSGGYCEGFTVAQTLQSCYQRTNGNLGSTKKATPSRSFDTEGLLSTLPQVNPVFYDWTKIYVIYCDGSEYTGSRKDPISYKDKRLYFRGYNNVLEQFRYLDQTFDFYNGESIVITGVSAGGMATYFYSNYLFENTKKAKVYAIPDSGLFVAEFYSPFVGFQPIKRTAENLFDLLFEQGQVIGYPIPQCLREYQQTYHCYNTANLAKYLKAPMFIVQSPYDQFSIDNIVVALCKSNKKPPFSIENCNRTQIDYIQMYRNQTIDALFKIKGQRNDVGIWAPSCVQHGFTDTESFTDARLAIPSANGPTIAEAIRQFLKDPYNAKVYLDQVPWPYNTACNGINKQVPSLSSQ